MVLSGSKERTHTYTYVIFEPLLLLVRFNISEWESFTSQKFSYAGSGGEGGKGEIIHFSGGGGEGGRGEPVMRTVFSLPLIIPSHRKTSPNSVESYSAGDIVSVRSELALEVGSSILVQITKILQAKHRATETSVPAGDPKIISNSLV